MKYSDPVLAATPPDATPDAGARHRGGPLTSFVALTCGLAAVGLGLLFLQQGARLEAAASVLVLGAAAGWAAWCLLERYRHRAPLARSHAVLAGALGFEIHCTCRDVAATVFFDPDRPARGTSTRLLCFLENYASRRRVARLCIGPHRHLGLAQPLRVSLALAAGEAAVYALPLTIDPALAPGEHDLPVTLTVRKPAGTGLRLPGTRTHLYNLWKVRFATPFTLTPAAAEIATAPARDRQPSFLTLASVSEPGPRFTALEELLTDAAPPREAAT
ncbi:MAG TPA: hypothetical protein VGD81_05865 [Opitutaceae bacterium]